MVNGDEMEVDRVTHVMTETADVKPFWLQVRFDVFLDSRHSASASVDSAATECLLLAHSRAIGQ